MDSPAHCRSLDWLQPDIPTSDSLRSHAGCHLRPDRLDTVADSTSICVEKNAVKPTPERVNNSELRYQPASRTEMPGRPSEPGNNIAAEESGAMAVGYAPSTQVVGRQLDRHFVAGEHLDVVFAHFPRQVSQHSMTVRYADLERGITHALGYRALHNDHIFFGNDDPLSICAHAIGVISISFPRLALTAGRSKTGLLRALSAKVDSS